MNVCFSLFEKKEGTSHILTLKTFLKFKMKKKYKQLNFIKALLDY